MGNKLIDCFVFSRSVLNTFVSQGLKSKADQRNSEKPRVSSGLKRRKEQVGPVLA